MIQFIRTAIALALLMPGAATAGQMVEPGDLLLRHDLQLLNDSGVIDVPLTSWPLSPADIAESLRAVEKAELSPSQDAAFDRIASRTDATFSFDVAGSLEARFIRTFEDTPRDEGEVGAVVSWADERFSFRLAATGVANPFDGDEFRPDGTSFNVFLGNWILSAGWQDRWWGPGRDGSLILSTNARPSPGIMLQRNGSHAFKTKWLSWMGPWTLTTFMTELDDDRAVPNARIFGIRGTFRPPRTGLEFGVSRTAQWCGDDRPCSFSTFGDLLLGKDNRGVNVDPNDEPGNQLAGIDVRWRVPKQVPAALYMQWIAEDGRGGGEGIGSWLRQLGAEFWGNVGSLQHRSHFEVSDSTCREGGFGFSDKKPGCAYHHSIYLSGYRYQSRSIAHGADGDSLSYSFGSTLVQSAGHSWNISIRHMKINREGDSRPEHTLSVVPAEATDFQLSHSRSLSHGRLHLGLGVSRSDNLRAGDDSTEFGGFLQWSSH